MALIPQLTLRKNSAPGFVNKGAALTSDEIDSNFVVLRQLVSEGGGGGGTGTPSNIPNTLVQRNASGNFSANIITATLAGNASSATVLQSARLFSILGDVTADPLSFDGSQNITFNTSLTPTGVIAGTYKSVTVDNKGRITSGTNPTTIAGFGITDAYTKEQVDALVQGLSLKDAVRAATTENIILSGEQTIDGVMLVSGDRVLVKDQTNATENGIYVVDLGPWMRSDDADTGEELESAFTFVQEGLVNDNTGWVILTDPPIIVGTTMIEWTQFSGAGEINAGAGLEKIGNVISIAPTGVIAGTFGNATNVPSIVVNDKGQITSVVNTPITFPVSSVVAGDGISAMTAMGVVTITNTGVTRLVAGPGIEIDPVGGTGIVSVSLAGGAGGVATSSFVNISGNTGTAVAEAASDTLSILGSDGINTVASDVNDSIVITPVYGTPVALGSAAAQGTAGTVARSDHVHPFPTASQLGALSEPNTNGFVVRSAPGTIVSRSLTSGAGISINNPDGVGGNPQIVNTGVTQIVAGTGVTISPAGGTGVVTINSSATAPTFSNIAVSGQPTISADAAADTLTLVAGTGISIVNNATTDTITISSTSVGGNAFGMINVAGQPVVEADSANDLLTLVAGAGITITTNAAADSVTFASNVLSFSTIVVSGQANVTADSPNDTLTLVAGPGIAITNNATTDTITIASTASSNSFSTIAVAGQSSVIADSAADTLTFVAGNNVTILTNATNDSVTINATVPNTFGNIAVAGQPTIIADSPTDTLTLVAGSGITILNDATTDTITITSSGGSTAITDDTTTNALFYPTFVNVTSGTASGFNVSSTKLTYNPSLGQLNATVFNTTSDANKKTNVKTVKGLDVVLASRGVEFDFIDTNQHSSGVIAQEAEKIVPHLVGSSDQGKTVNYDGYVAYLIESIKELHAEIQSLKAQIGK